MSFAFRLIFSGSSFTVTPSVIDILVRTAGTTGAGGGVGRGGVSVCVRVFLNCGRAPAGRWRIIPGRAAGLRDASGRVIVAGRCAVGGAGAPGRSGRAGLAGRVAAAGRPSVWGAPGRWPSGGRPVVGAPVAGALLATGAPGRAPVVPAGRITPRGIGLTPGSGDGVRRIIPVGVDEAGAGLDAVVGCGAAGRAVFGRGEAGPATAGGLTRDSSGRAVVAFAVTAFGFAATLAVDFFGTAALGAVVFFAAFLGLPTFFLVATGADDLVAFGVDFEALARGETRAAKAERRFVTASSSSVLRFVLASTPCRLSQAMASATGILSSFAICPTRVFAI